MPDDLRSAIADLLSAALDGIDMRDEAAAIVALIPEHAPAILNLIGDVVGDVWLPDYFVSGSTTDFQGFGIEPPGARPQHYFKATVVSLGAAAKETPPTGIVDSGDVLGDFFGTPGPGAAAKECPKCGGDGWTVECCGDANTTGDCCGSPVQVQCDCALGAAAKETDA